MDESGNYFMYGTVTTITEISTVTTITEIMNYEQKQSVKC